MLVIENVGTYMCWSTSQRYSRTSGVFIIFYVVLLLFIHTLENIHLEHIRDMNSFHILYKLN